MQQVNEINNQKQNIPRRSEDERSSRNTTRTYLATAWAAVRRDDAEEPVELDSPKEKEMIEGKIHHSYTGHI